MWICHLNHVFLLDGNNFLVFADELSVLVSLK